jgi:hypothetical protein
MTHTSRRDVLTGAAGLAAGAVVPLSAAAAAIEEPKPMADMPFRIEPSANYLELKRLAILINEAVLRRRAGTWRKTKTSS